MSEKTAVLLLGTFAAFLLITRAQAQDPKQVAIATKPFVTAYMACVVEQAKRFASSPDSAEFIIKVAMRACRDERDAIRDAAFRAGMQSVIEILEFIDKDTEQAAAIAVLEARATAKQ